MKKIVLLMLFIISIYILNAETFYVGNGHICSEISQAVEIASDNDTIIVERGVYSYFIVESKNLTIRSRFFETNNEEDIQNTIISYPDVYIIGILNSQIEIDGFNIDGGIYYSRMDNGDGLSKITNCRFRADEWSIKYVDETYSTLLVDYCKFSNSSGISCSRGNGDIVVNNSQFNNGYKGICILPIEPTINRRAINLSVNNCEFYDYSLYGIEFDDADVCISNTLIKNSNIAICASDRPATEEANLINCTIINNDNAFQDVNIAGGFNHIENTIVYGNDTFNLHSSASITYSCLQSHWTGEGNIFVDPLLINNQPSWNSTQKSPCIDSGDPSTEWDEDGTPPDIGAIPAIEHKYDERLLWDTQSIINETWHWISFPSLDNLTTGNDLAENVLSPILNIDILDFMEWIELESSYFKKIQWDETNNEWTNILEVINSIQGYKIKLNDNIDQDALLQNSGFLQDPNTEIPLIAGIENWIGYFLENSATPEIAFGEIWDNIKLIQHQNWYMFRLTPGGQWFSYQAQDWVGLQYGEMAIVKVFEDCTFHWTALGANFVGEQPQSDVFSYEKKSDYLPITIETDSQNPPSEVGVFIDGECKGFGVVEDDFAHINAYILDQPGANLDFVMNYENRAGSKKITNYQVMDNKNLEFVSKKLKFESGMEFAIVKLSDENNPINFTSEISVNNYPNPFNPETNISFFLPESQDVELEIFNLKGQLVKSVYKGNLNIGVHNMIWKGNDNNGNKASSGIYFYKLSTKVKTFYNKMIMLK